MGICFILLSSIDRDFGGNVSRGISAGLMLSGCLDEKLKPIEGIFIGIITGYLAY